MRFIFSAAGLLTLSLLHGCAPPVTSSGPSKCAVVGETSPCTCPDGTASERTCETNKKYGACNCTDKTAGTDADATFSPGDGASVDGVDGTDVTDGTDGIDGTTGEDGTDSSVPIVVEEPCQPGHTMCGAGKDVLICNEAGTGYVASPCPPEQACLEGKCSPLVCEPDQPTGKCIDENAAEKCNSTGTALVPDYCTAIAPKCIDGVCKVAQCTPGAKKCKGLSAIDQCAEDGSGWKVLEICEGGLCKEGKCVTACDANLKENTYTGCEYFAVDLDNVGKAENQPVAVVVSNPNKSKESKVTITNTATGALLPLQSDVVAPMGQSVFLLPTGFNINGFVKAKRSFQIKSSLPVTVHQFNPLNAVAIYTNDASLLLPANVGGKEFLAMTWPQRGESLKQFRGYFTVIAVEKGETNVVVKAPADMIGAATTIKANVETTFKLEQGEVLNLQTAGKTPMIDLTGAHITADKKLSVFGGHECANIPLQMVGSTFKGVNYCDHIESQLFPVSTWGKFYVADAFHPRSPAQQDIWRIMAGANDVIIFTDPVQPGGNQKVLQKGEFIEFSSSQSFIIKATGPVSVGHYLTGSNYAGYVPAQACKKGLAAAKTGIGDPAFTLLPPTKQMRTDYIVMTPENYIENYLNISYQEGADIIVDGVPVQLNNTPVGVTEWRMHAMKVQPGVHRISTKSKKAFGVTAYGYDCDVSYAYPGGLNLDPDVEEEQ